MRTVRAVTVLSIVAASSTGWAQSACFNPVTPGVRPSSHLAVGPGARFEPSAQCRYAVRPRGASQPAPGQPLGPGPRDTAEFLRDLGAPVGALADDLEVAAQHADAPAQVETLALRPCASRLGEGSTVLRFEPQFDGAVGVRIVPAQDRCPTDDAELVAVPGDTRDTVMRGAPPAGARVLSLSAAGHADFPGDGASWSIYLRRRGSDAAVRVDVLRLGDTRTPLRQRFAAPGDAPWLRADWSHGALRMTPNPAVLLPDGIVWSELVTAASSQAVLLAGPDARRGAAVYTIPVDVDGASAQVPDAAVQVAMRARYGAQGSSMVPSRDDWRRVFGSLRMCHRGEYRPDASRSAHALPTELAAMACVPVAQVSSNLADESETLGAITLERHLDVIGRTDAVAVTQAPEAVRDSVTLDVDGPVRFVTPGDVVRAPAALPTGRALSLCRVADGAPDAHPVAVRAGEAHTFGDDDAGLWQVVLRPEGEPGCSRQDLAVARIAVVDARRAWIPVGLHEHGEMDLRDPWKSLETSGDDTFVFHVRSGLPEFRVRTTADVAAAVNAWLPAQTEGDPDPAPRLQREIPVRLRSEPPARSPGVSALVVLLTEADTCPVDERALIPNLRALPSEATLHAFLAAERVGSEGPRFTCLARARLRAIPPLVHRGSDAGPFYVRWGLPGAVSLRAQYEVLGDCQGSRCLSLGVAMPLVYARISPNARAVSWLGVEFSIPLVLSASPGDGRALHTGVGLDAALTFGPRSLPRLVSVGVLFQPTVLAVGPYGSSGGVDLAPYLGVNLSSLFDAIRSE